ncbi:MAG: hypothetical protein ACI9OJ_003477, partial [Myxococcota bacterium]
MYGTIKPTLWTAVMALLLAGALLIPAISSAENAAWVFEAPDTTITYTSTLQDLIDTGSALTGASTITIATRAQGRTYARAIRIASTAATMNEVDLGQLHAVIYTHDPKADSVVRITVDAPLGKVAGSVTLPLDLVPGRRALSFRPGAVTGEFKGANLDLDAFSGALPIGATSGKATVKLVLGGSTKAVSADMRVSVRKLGWNGADFGDIVASWEHKNHRSSVNVRFGHPTRPTGRFVGNFPIKLSLSPVAAKWDDAGPFDVDFELNGIDRKELASVFKLPKRVGFEANLTVKAKGTLFGFDMTAGLNGHINHGSGWTKLTINAKVGRSVQSLKAQLGDGLAELMVKTSIPLVSLKEGLDGVRNATIKGQLSLAVPLHHLEAYLPRAVSEPTGDIVGQVRITGSVGSPIFNGHIDASDAEATLGMANRRLSDVQFKVEIAKNDFVIKELSGVSTGKASASGRFKLNTEVPPKSADSGLWDSWHLMGSAAMKLERFPVVVEGFPVSLVDATVDVTAEIEKGVSALDVIVRDGAVTITEEELPNTASVPHNGLVSIGATEDGSRNGSTSPLAGKGRLVLKATLQTPVSVKGKTVDLKLSGALQLDRKGTRAEVTGGFDIAPGGRFDLFENEFDITGGKVTLTEGLVGAGNADPRPAGEAVALQPTLSLVARAKVIDTSVLVKLRGPMAKQELVLVSVPALPEYQIMTLLIIGRVDTVDGRSGSVRRQIANLVRRYHNPGLKAQLFAKMGVDKLGLKFGSGIGSPILNVGKQINRQLFLETVYHHNAPPDVNQYEVHVEYQVASKWKLDTILGDKGEGRFGVFWGTTYGGPDAPAPPDENWGLGEVPRHQEDADKDGVANSFDGCRESPEDKDGFEDADGCPEKDNDGDRIVDSKDAAPNEA